MFNKHLKQCFKSFKKSIDLELDKNLQFYQKCFQVEFDKNSKFWTFLRGGQKRSLGNPDDN